jgi:homocysteine S-methyltransferase
MRESLLDALRERVIVADGAMGTMLYSKGVYLNRCYDEMNLSQPETVREIHHEYLQAGAQLIETNTFGANPVKLEPHGLAERAEEICRRGAELARDEAGDRAWVAGSVGPLGKPLSPIGKIDHAAAVELFRPQIRGLVAGGVDLIVLETMNDIAELTAAIEAARAECTLPVMALATFPAEGRTLLGFAPEEVTSALARLGAQVVGANCSEGPHDMLDTIGRLRQGAGELPVMAMPNAGHPRFHDDRVLYMTSPEYMAEYARRFIQAGASLVGGCCGTTPEHIRAMVAMVKSLKPARIVAPAIAPLERAPVVEPVPTEQRSPLGAKLAGRSVVGHRFVVSVEMNPPRGYDTAKVLAAAEQLKFHGVDVVNVPDGPRASARMSALHIAALIEQRVGMETVLHYTCRDRNLLGMQADLLGAHAMGLRNILAVTGDPPKLGDYPHVTAVYDVESIGLVRILAGLNRGVDLAASPIGEPTRFLIGVGVNPGTPDLERELRRFRYKVEAGASFCMTQPVYETGLLERFLERTADVRIPVLVGILPLASSRNAEFLHNEVPGMQIPAPIRERMRKAGSGDAARDEGIAIAQEALAACRPLVQGVYIMPPFGRVEAAIKVLEAL